MSECDVMAWDEDGREECHPLGSHDIDSGSDQRMSHIATALQLPLASDYVVYSTYNTLR